MKIILKIARTELRNLFYSPVAWFLTVVFLVMTGMIYTGALKALVKAQEKLVENMPKFKDFGQSLTDVIFMRSGLLDQIFHNLYLFIPLLTMGIISREKTSGTVKLLYSSPVKIRQIVLGKYLAVMAYNLVLLGIVMIFIVSGIFNIQSADYGKLLAGGLGFYLLVCAYTALGMFMSSLTHYQVVSAVATFTLIFALNAIGGLWQQYDFVRDLTYVLSMKGRTRTMLFGLITTKDVMYFLLIVGMFLTFTMLRLKFARLLLPWYKKAAAYTGVVLVVLTIGYLTARPGYIGYWDTTARKEMTIHPRTQAILASLGDAPVEVTLYTNLLAEPKRVLPENRQEYVWFFWDQYVRFKPNIQFKYVLYYDTKDGDSSLYRQFPGKDIHQLAAIHSDMFGYPVSRFLPPAELRKQVDLQAEDCRTVMQLKYKGRSVFLRTFRDIKFWPDEEHVAAAFKVLADGKSPKMYFVSGHYERSIYKSGEREYSAATNEKLSRAALINHGYTIDTVSLDGQEVPADADVLVLADPKSALSTVAQEKIRSYLEKGGHMIFTGEPGKQQMLNPILQPLGVQLGQGTVVEVTANEMPHKVEPYVTWAATELGDDPILLHQKEQLARGLDTIRLPFTGTTHVAVADSGFTVKHLTVTHGRNAWVKAGHLVVDSAAPVFNPVEGDYRPDSASTAIALSRKVGDREQRIVITGDADFASTKNLAYLWFWKDLNSWIRSNHLPALLPYPPPADALFTISSPSVKMLHWIYVWILPAVIVAFGTILLIRRKRK